MDDARLAWVRGTTFGAAVVPEVSITAATSLAVARTGAAAAGEADLHVVPSGGSTAGRSRMSSPDPRVSFQAVPPAAGGVVTKAPCRWPGPIVAFAFMTARPRAAARGASAG